MKRVSFCDDVDIVEIPKYVRPKDFISHLESHILLLRLSYRSYLRDNENFVKGHMNKIVNSIVFHKDVSSIIIHKPLINNLSPFINDIFKLLELKFKHFKDAIIKESQFTHLIVFKCIGKKNKSPCIDEDLSLYNI